MTVAPGHPRGAASAIIVVGGDVTVSITVGRPGGDREEAVSALREYAHAGDIVLVKGSRSEKLEQIIEALGAA